MEKIVKKSARVQKMNVILIEGASIENKVTINFEENPNKKQVIFLVYFIFVCKKSLVLIFN